MVVSIGILYADIHKLRLLFMSPKWVASDCLKGALQMILALSCLGRQSALELLHQLIFLPLIVMLLRNSKQGGHSLEGVVNMALHGSHPPIC